MCHLVARGITARLETSLFFQGSAKGWQVGWEKMETRTILCALSGSETAGIKETPGRVKEQVTHWLVIDTIYLNMKKPKVLRFSK